MAGWSEESSGGWRAAYFGSPTARALGASVGVGSGTAPLPCGCLRPPTRQVLRGLRIDHSECSDVKVNWTPTGGLAVAAAEATALPDMTNAERLRYATLFAHLMFRQCTLLCGSGLNVVGISGFSLFMLVNWIFFMVNCS
uniref:Uncharacterized protein n=1 Tax=Oryza barthii TaxID=65489 RepID=A0A0D3GRQ7_9ORYZ